MKRNQMLAVGLMIMAVAVTVQSALSDQTSPPGPDVRVVNTQTNPVPVSVINFPTGTNTVIVSSSTSAPLLVRQVDSGAMQPVFILGPADVPEGQSLGISTVYQVPTGKRLVIEYIAFDLNLPAGQNVLRSQLSGVGVPVFLVAISQFTGTAGSTAVFQSSQLVKAYVTGPASLSADVHRDDTAGHVSGTVSINGYLMDIP